MKLINSLFSPTPTNDLAAKRQQRALAHARTCLAEFDRERLVFGSRLTAASRCREGCDRVLIATAALSRHTTHSGERRRLMALWRVT